VEPVAAVAGGTAESGKRDDKNANSTGNVADDVVEKDSTDNDGANVVGGDSVVDVGGGEGDVTNAVVSSKRKDYDLVALLEKKGTFEPSKCSVKLVALNCEYELRVHFCWGIVNVDKPDAINPFVIIVFNGRDIGTTEVMYGDSYPSWNSPE